MADDYTLASNGQEFLTTNYGGEPWFNLLANDRYSIELAQTGQARLSLTGELTTQPTWRYIYLRDNDSGQVWSLTWQPVGAKFGRWQCRYKINQIDWELTKDNIAVTAVAFVPTGFDGEIWRLTVRNLGSGKRRLSVFFSAGLPDSVQQANLVKDILVGQDRRSPAFSYFLAADRALSSFDCHQETFLGPLANPAAPQNIIDGKCSRSNASTEPAVLVLQHNLSLGASPATINYFVGATADLTTVRRRISSFKQPGVVAAAADKSEQFWTSQLGHVSVKTDDPNFDPLFNHWLKFQAATCDQLLADQAGSDVNNLVLSPLNRDQLGERLARQLKSGGVADVVTTLNLLDLTINFAKETGDLEAFNHSIAFADGGSGTILQHFVRGLNFAQSAVSNQGLVGMVANDQPLASAALTGRLAYVIRQAQPILSHFNEHYLIDSQQKLLVKLAEAVNTHLRRGQYYLDQLPARSAALGRQIDSTAQAWLIIGGLVSPDRAKKALQTVGQKLASPVGVLNFGPAYANFNPDDKDSAASPGAGSNSSVVTETMAALIWAQTVVGQGDAALRLWSQINPLVRARRYGAAPFLVAETSNGPAHPRAGRANGGWGSRGVGQLWRVLLEQVLGVQPQLGGLKISPCLPKDWRRVDVTRHWRGADYHIRINNPFRVSSGVDRISVDGVRLTGNVIRPFAGGSHYVEVTLG